MIGRVARAYPTMLRVGVAEAVAYRAEFLVWILTTTLPLVNMALWTAVAREGGPVGGYSTPGFVAYFLAALVIRQLTGSWVLWEMNQEIRQGQLSARLLRPMHPYLAYSAENLGAIPLRAVIMVPLVTVALVFAPRSYLHLLADPARLGVIAASLVGSWLITFATMSLVGTLGFYMESALGAFDIWFAVYSICSGYVVPLAVFPRWFGRAVRWLPFYHQLGYPAELMIGRIGGSDALVHLGTSFAWGLGLLGASLVAFRRGIKQYAAFGS